MTPAIPAENPKETILFLSMIRDVMQTQLRRIVVAHVILLAVPAAPVWSNESLDVILDSGGSIHGVLVNESGAALDDQFVRISSGEDRPAIVAGTTDAFGRFSVLLPSGAGVYTCTVDGESVTLTVWGAGSSPPESAARRVLLVLGPTVRGQSPPAEPIPTTAGTAEVSPVGHCRCVEGQTCDFCCPPKRLGWLKRLRCFPCRAWGHRLMGRRLGFTAAAVGIFYAAIEEDDAS